MSNPAQSGGKVEAREAQKKVGRPDAEVPECPRVVPATTPNRQSGNTAPLDNCQSIKLNGAVRIKTNKMIRKFVDDHPDLTIKTQAIYKGILNDFIKYSPAETPMDLHKFILHRFPNESFVKDDELYLKGNAIKYCNIITRFLKINSKNVHMKIHKKYYTKSISNSQLY